MKPSYSITKFQDACKYKQGKVYVAPGAMETARIDFSLNVQRDVLNFIGYGGLEGLEFRHTNLWKKNPEPTELIMVDSYGFYSGKLHGYIAFMYRKGTNKWFIKSFKKNNEPDTRNPAFRILESLIIN